MVRDKSAWQKSEAVEDILTTTWLLPHAGPKSAKHMKERRQHLARILSELTRVIFAGGSAVDLPGFRHPQINAMYRKRERLKV